MANSHSHTLLAASKVRTKNDKIISYIESKYYFHICRIMKKLVPGIVFLIFSTPLFSQSWKTYPYAPIESLITFPVDEGRHSSEPAEWWYTMGHLTGNSSGKHYSYMLSYFYYPISVFDGFRILNICDDDLGLFFSETLPLNYNILATDSLNIEAFVYQGGVERWHNRTDIQGNALPFEYEITTSDTTAGRVLSLEYDALKPPLILADSGFLYQGAEAYSYYYSQTQNAVSGSITFNGITENVTGSSWIDRQYGTFNPSEGHEYEWFCFQLSNGMDFNIYNIFSQNYEIPNDLKHRLFSAYIDEDDQLTTSDFEIERLSYQYMPDSTMCYSQMWRIICSVPEVDIFVSVLHPNYEVFLPFRFYEGPATITGTVDGNAVSGIGFAELVHSYKKPEIQIINLTFYNDASCLLKWQLTNPDDGNPTKYDLEYSIDNKQNFLPIAQEIADTFFYWDTQTLTEINNIWLKVKGYSIDHTISGTRTERLFLAPLASNNPENRIPVNIYPNPSEGKVTIAGENILKIEIFDVNGKMIFTTNLNQAEQSVIINVQPDGNYFVQVTTGSGTTIEKLLIE